MPQHPLRGTFLFVVAGKADADNIAPAIWSIAREGQPVLIFVANEQVYRDFATAWWRADCPAVQLRRIRGATATGIRQRLMRILWNRMAVRRELRRHDVRLVVMEWEEGIAYRRPSWQRRFVQWLSTDFFLQVQLAAHDLAVPTVALPHGHSTKTTIIRSQHVVATMNANGGKLPFADRDSHAAYVFCSGYHRDVILAHSTMSGANVKVWGSARFNDEWVAQLYAATPAATLPALRAGQLRRVLFFFPKWNNLIDRTKSLQLLAALGARNEIQLVVRGHVRSNDAMLNKSEREALESSANIVFVEDTTSSASIIKACDVLIDVDSSIAFDAVLLGKPYVRPRYLQDRSVKTIWDELGGAHQTDSLGATIALVTQPHLPSAERDARFDEVVFGGSGAIVLRQFRDGLVALVAPSH